MLNLLDRIFFWLLVVVFAVGLWRLGDGSAPYACRHGVYDPAHDCAKNNPK